jgi:hypothetical protein
MSYKLLARLEQPLLRRSIIEKDISYAHDKKKEGYKALNLCFSLALQGYFFLTSRCDPPER